MGLCLAVCGIAAVTDVRHFRIPNWLTLGGIALGVLTNMGIGIVKLGWSPGLTLGLADAAGGCLLLLIVFGLLAGMGLLGWGDVKLLGAVGAFVRTAGALHVMIYVTLAGGAIAIAVALWQGRLGQVLNNIGRIGRGMVGRQASRPVVHMHRIPYALAIVSGVIWLIASRLHRGFALL